MEPFLVSRQLCNCSRTSLHFMEPEGLLPRELSTSPILSQIDPVRTIAFNLRCILILSTYLRFVLHNGLFPSIFPTNILFSLIRATCPPWLAYSDYTIYEAPHYAGFSSVR
jgi:hypothetical protein